ncbi:arrestin domain-containing protein 3-like [Toxorhynchites rutilus septentrionalis]|uniref:arrestin domain-containing protein 3-like n=1 Tax=Toxorhynchites rutilus septentrionalis TaxID=329112 RepID=UPI002479B34C|nr:arrestin domain-containing protein 3-like [Toxorhynchites rutilus septentrionalis]
MPKEKPSKKVNCQVRFDSNPNAIFRAGDAVSGTVILTLTKLKKVKGVYVLISGFAETFWDGKVYHGPKNRKTKAHFKGYEDFIDKKIYLVESDDGSPIDLPMGSNQYHIRFDIPSTASTSMEGRHGHVRYLVKIVLERPWKYDQNFQTPLTVLARANSQSSHLSKPIKVEDQLRFYCWMCRSDPLLVAATVPRSGYVPGETIDVTLTVNNLSKEEVSEIIVKFQKVIQFISQVQIIGETQLFAENKIVKYELLEIQKTLSVAKLTNTKFEKQFVVGPITPTENQHCDVIKIGYEMHISVKPRLSRQTIEMTIPIVVGSSESTTNEVTPFQRSSGIEKLAMHLDETLPTAPPPPYFESSCSIGRINSIQSVYEREISEDN